jgi:FlaG protein
MSLEIGPTPQRPANGVSAARSTSAAFQATLKSVTPASPAPADTVSIGIPASPPPDVLDEVGAAADRVAAFAAKNRELHFSHDSATGRVVVQVRDLDSGKVVRTIPPSGALAALAGEIEL